MTSSIRQNNDSTGADKPSMASIDFTNIDDIAASIKSFALEIENLPFAKTDEQVEKISEPTIAPKSTPLELPCAPSALNNNTCYFKTRSGGFKDY